MLINLIHFILIKFTILLSLKPFQYCLLSFNLSFFLENLKRLSKLSIYYFLSFLILKRWCFWFFLIPFLHYEFSFHRFFSLENLIQLWELLIYFFYQLQCLYYLISTLTDFQLLINLYQHFYLILAKKVYEVLA